MSSPERDKTERSPSTGEDLYAWAQSLPHREIPDPILDGDYLMILRKAAEKGHQPAIDLLDAYAAKRKES